MTYDKYFLLFYVVVTIVTNIVAKLKGEKDFPFLIVLFGVFMFLTSLKTFLYGIFLLVFFPFANIYVTFFNTRKRKPFLETSSDNQFEGYEISFGQDTMLAIENSLNKNGIKFKNKYLKNNVKYILILSLREFIFYIYKKREKEVEINSKEMISILNKNFGFNIIDETELLLLKRDILKYIEKGEEQISNLELKYIDGKLFLQKDYVSPKIYKKGTIEF